MKYGTIAREFEESSQVANKLLEEKAREVCVLQEKLDEQAKITAELTALLENQRKNYETVQADFDASVSKISGQFDDEKGKLSKVVKDLLAEKEELNTRLDGERRAHEKMTAELQEIIHSIEDQMQELLRQKVLLSDELDLQRKLHEKNVQELQEIIHSLEDQVQTVQSARNQHEDLLKEQENKLAELENANGRLTAALENERKKARQYQEQYETTQADWQTLQQRLSSASERTAELEKRRGEELEALQRKYAEMLDELQAKTRQLERVVQNLEQERNAAQEKALRMEGQLIEFNDEFLEETRQLKAEIERLQALKEADRQEFMKQNAESRKSYDCEVKHLHEQLDNFDSRIKALNDESAKHVVELSEKMREIAELKRLYNGLEEASNDEINEMKKRIDKYEDVLIQIKQSLFEKERENEEIMSKLASKTTKLHMIECQTSKEREEFATEKASLECEISRLEHSNERRRGEIQKLSVQCDEMRKTIEELNDKMNEIQFKRPKMMSVACQTVVFRHEHAEIEAHAKETTLIELRHENEQMRKKLVMNEAARFHEVQRLSEKLQMLQQANEDLTEEIGRLEEERQLLNEELTRYEQMEAESVKKPDTPGWKHSSKPDSPDATHPAPLQETVGVFAKINREVESLENEMISKKEKMLSLMGQHTAYASKAKRNGHDPTVKTRQKAWENGRVHGIGDARSSQDTWEEENWGSAPIDHDDQLTPRR
jgi:chromosome segregation ATPase